MNRIVFRAGGPFLIAIVVGCAASVMPQQAMGQSSSVTKQAQSLVDSRYRGEVLFISGKGSPTEVNNWTYYFYDPTAPHNFREVRIIDGKVDLFQPTDVHRTAVSNLVFDPAHSPVSVEAALKTTQDYASQNQITYNQTRVVLRRPAAGQAPAWRVEMLQDDRSRGVVYTDSPKAGFVRYAAAAAPTPKSSSDNGGPHNAAEFGEDVKSTFLGVGGDLQEFFTGKRTVDK